MGEMAGIVLQKITDWEQHFKLVYIYFIKLKKIFLILQFSC